MFYLILGLALFAGVHLFPTFVSLRQTLIGRLGENGYKGLFTVVAVAGLVFMVIGKGDADVQQIWSPPAWGRTATSVMMLFSLSLFAAANMPTNIKRFTRHPMLWGLTLWSVGHLLANGDLASIVLFGGLGVYALLGMASANMRGALKQTVKYPVTKDAMVAVAGVVAYALFLFLHPYLTGGVTLI